MQVEVLQHEMHRIKKQLRSDETCSSSILGSNRVIQTEAMSRLHMIPPRPRTHTNFVGNELIEQNAKPNGGLDSQQLDGDAG